MKPIFAVPATAALVYRAYSKKSLTPAGIVVATLTAIAHAYHPWNLPFVLLIVFFLAGTRATHIKEDVKASLTLSAKGSSGGEGPRTHVQVLANSLTASVLTVLHAYQLRAREASLAEPQSPPPAGTQCFSWGGDILVVGIIANYAAVAADTFSSELGILSKHQPRLITSLTLRKVPKGTNGGVTLWGLTAGLLGSMVIVTTATLFLPMCNENTAELPGGGAPWLMGERRQFMTYMVLWGAFGSVLDSVLGGIFQQSIIDVRSGKVVEGEGGVRALASPSSDGSAARADARAAILEGESKNVLGTTDEVAVDETSPSKKRYDPSDKHRKASFGDRKPSRIVGNGLNWLDNNDVNFLMAVMMSVGAMAGASWMWGVPIEDVLKP